ncbi:ArpU family transcriptional regulator [Peribacillus sp. TH24]|uniref:ArpU family transcriptional regulator n=1 Tax=Peribacillus sp. TH24 TaxID=2798483 RepID=UPI0037C715F8
MSNQLSFFPDVDEKQICSIVVKELKLFRALKIQQQNKKELNEKGIKGNIFPKLHQNDLVNEIKVLQMERALRSLESMEREIIEKNILAKNE